jgi:hypothetical protein
MDPATLAMMYAANVGINALGGKRGSNLWKDSFKDTTTQALTMQLTGGLNQGQKPMVGADDMSLSITDSLQEKIPMKGGKGTDIIDAVTKVSETQKPVSDYDKWLKSLPELAKDQSTVSVTPGAKEGWRGWFDKAAGTFKSEQPIIGEGGSAATKIMRTPDGKVVRVPVTMSQMDPLKVGLGSLGAAGTAYGLGMFDPEPPQDPKYPGYNKFYAQNPGQFMPYDDPNIDPIDYSKYPEKPYSGIKTGGIISLQEGGPVSYKNILQTDYGYEREYLDNLEMNEGPGAVKELYDSLQGKKRGGIMKLTGGGQALTPQELFNKVMMEGYRPTPEEQQLINVYLQSQSGQKKGGIMKLARGGKASNEPVKSTSELTDEDAPQPDPTRPKPRMPGKDLLGPGGMDPEEWKKKLQERLQYMAVKSGALIHKLPHKTKQNENNPKNYKRTSGKLVVDNKGKGNEEKDTMLAQLADGEFVTKSKAVRGAGIALGADPKNQKQQRDIGARFFYKQMAEFDKLAKRMAS